MKKTQIINIIGWIFLIILSISKIFFSVEFSFITTGFGGLVCLIIGLFLSFYKPRSKK